jgi:propanol-preferring alcohol dehydrogenase
MRSYQVHKQGPIEANPLVMVERDVEEPGIGQVRILVEACGICHTDLHIAEGDLHPPNLPITPGHQVIGKIDKIGPPKISGNDREEIWIGKKVGVAWLHTTCGTCVMCMSGSENLCENAKFTGFHLNGGFAETMIADTSALLPIPENCNPVDYAPFLCAGIVGYRAVKRANVLDGDHIGLFGFGASAHLMLQVLKARSCRVSVFTRSTAHQNHATELGADWVGMPDQKPRDLLDNAILFTPAGESVVRALERIRNGGTVSINAIHMSDLPTIPYSLLYGEKTITSVTNATYQDAIEFLALAEKINLKTTVKPISFDELNAAMRDLKKSAIIGEAVLKVI